MEIKANRAKKISTYLLHFFCTLLVVMIIGKLIERYLHGGSLDSGHYAAMFAAALLGNKYSPLIRKTESKENT